MRLLLLFLFLSCPAAPLSAESTPCLADQRAVARFRLTPTPHPTSTVLIVPGLNNTPTSFGDLGELLLRHGHNVLEVALAGQALDDRPVDLTQWVCDVSAATRAAESLSPGLPIAIVGFSLGAAVTVEALDRNPELRPHRLALLAPAVALRTKAYLLRPLLWLRIFDISLPSLTPRPFRYADRTPLAAYNALFEAVDATTELKNPERLQAIAGLVILHEADELISPGRVEAWLRGNRLSWEFDIIPRTQEVTPPAHLLADLGRLVEAGRQQALISFLASTNDGQQLIAAGRELESRAAFSPRSPSR